MDFISKLLQKKPNKSGSGNGHPVTTAAKPPVEVTPQPSKSLECETSVQFAREFVEELVENIPKLSEKTASGELCQQSEDKVILKPVSTEALPESLPDLLLPEAAFKKQSDTDTDTTEYESAAETDPPDGISHSGSLLAEDVANVFDTVEATVTQHSLAESSVESIETASSCTSNNLCGGLNSLKLVTPDVGPVKCSLAEHTEEGTGTEYRETVVPEACNVTIQNSSSDLENSLNVPSETKDLEVNTSAESIKTTSSGNISTLCAGLNNLQLGTPDSGHYSTIQTEEYIDTLENRETVEFGEFSTSSHGSSGNKGESSISDAVVLGQSKTNNLESGSGVAQVESVNTTFKKSEADKNVEKVSETDEHIQQNTEVKATDVSINEFITGSRSPLKDTTPVQNTFSALGKAGDFIPLSDKEKLAENRLNQENSNCAVEDNKNNSNKNLPELPNLTSVSEGKSSDGYVNADTDVPQEVVAYDSTSAAQCPISESVTTEVLNKAVSKYTHNSIHSSGIIADCNSVKGILQSTKHSYEEIPEPLSTSPGEINFTKDLTKDKHLDTSVCFEENLTAVGVVNNQELDSQQNLIVAKTNLEIGIGCTDQIVVGVESKKLSNNCTNVPISDCPSQLPGSSSLIKANSQQDYRLYKNIIDICQLQEKDLEKEDLTNSNLNSVITAEVSSSVESEGKLTNCSSKVLDFGNGDLCDIFTEAEKVAEEVFNVSQELDEKDNVIDNSIIGSIGSERLFSMDEQVDPFASKSSLRHSPPQMSRTHSPNNSSSRGNSPSKRNSPVVADKNSPKLKNRNSAYTPVKDKIISDDPFKTSSKISNSPPVHLPAESPVKSNKMLEEQDPQNPLRGKPIVAEANHSEAGPETADESQTKEPDVFQEASTFDFLSSVGSSQTGRDLRKESLYVKFDPLVGAAANTDKAVPIPPQVEKNGTGSSHTGPSNLEFSRLKGDVDPASNQALAYIDRLIALSPTPMKPEKLVDQKKKNVNQPCNSVLEVSCSKKDQSCTNTSVSSIGWDGAVDPELIQEAMLNEMQELRDIIARQEQAHNESIKSLESKIEAQQQQLKEKDDEIQKMNKKIAKMTEGQDQISIIMEEYERTISRLVLEKEQEKQAYELEKENLIKDKDTISGHLANIEIAFSDVHRKYERSKDVIQGIKSNEEALRTSLAEYEATIKEQEQRYEILKTYATSQLDSANQELESMRRSHQAENAKLNAMLKKAEVKASSLEEMLEQKIKENQELASICDELIGKVGTSE